jgi:hypothetical protein
MEGGENLDTKTIIKGFSDFELTVMEERLQRYLMSDKYGCLEYLYFLIVEEINNRKLR